MQNGPIPIADLPEKIRMVAERMDEFSETPTVDAYAIEGDIALYIRTRGKAAAIVLNFSNRGGWDLLSVEIGISVVCSIKAGFPNHFPSVQLAET